jgi:hypothetical protein
VLLFTKEGFPGVAAASRTKAWGATAQVGTTYKNLNVIFYM